MNKAKNFSAFQPFSFSAKLAFSLAELMIVMLILTIILAATMPILSKRAKVKAAAAAAGGGIKTANEGDSCVDGTDTIAYSKDYAQILTCMPTKTLGDSCADTDAGKKAVDTSTMSGTDNPYVHLVCVKD